MADHIRSRTGMIAGMTPTLRDETYVFATVPDIAGSKMFGDALATFREDEGVSVILSANVAKEHGVEIELAMRCITLQVYSSLVGVGLTAAVSQALADEGIACNMVAAYHHDHAFVPAEDAERALDILHKLQSEVAGTE